MWGAARNTLGLLSDKADLVTGELAHSLRQHLDPVREASAYLNALIRRGEIDVTDTVDLAAYMRGAMAATPQVLAMDFVSPVAEIVRIIRPGDKAGIQLLSGADDARYTTALSEARIRGEAFWGRPVWSERAATTLVNLRTPIRRDGRFVGLLVSTVSVHALSRFLREAQLGALPDRFISLWPQPRAGAPVPGGGHMAALERCPAPRHRADRRSGPGQYLERIRPPEPGAAGRQSADQRPQNRGRPKELSGHVSHAGGLCRPAAAGGGPMSGPARPSETSFCVCWSPASPGLPCSAWGSSPRWSLDMALPGRSRGWPRRPGAWARSIWPTCRRCRPAGCARSTTPPRPSTA